MRGLRAAAAMLALVAAQAAWAVQPDEVLADAALEHRAREIGQMLRCPVCQGENIDESNAPSAATCAFTCASGWSRATATPR